MYTHDFFEAYTVEEVNQFLALKKPTMWRRFKRKDDKTQRTIYGVDCYTLNENSKYYNERRY